MKPVMQSVIGSGDDGQPMGTCMRASIASVMELQEDDIPKIEQMTEGSDWFMVLLKFFKEHGLEYHGIGKAENINNPKYAKGVDGYILATGGSPRGFRRGHMVVYKDGKLAHDPHPSGAGVIPLEEFWMVERINENS